MPNLGDETYYGKVVGVGTDGEGKQFFLVKRDGKTIRLTALEVSGEMTTRIEPEKPKTKRTKK